MPSQMPRPCVTSSSGQPDGAGLAQHLLALLALLRVLGGVGIQEGSMDTTRLTVNRIGHQRHDGAETNVKPEAMI